MTDLGERLLCNTIVAGFPLQITTVTADPLNTGNERVFIEWRVETADDATTFVAGRSQYGSHNEASRAAEDMLETLRQFSTATRDREPPTAG